MADITDKFFELIQISLGNKDCFELSPSDKEWGRLFQLSCKHSLAGVLFEGFKKAQATIKAPKDTVLYEWYALQLQTVNANQLQIEKATELYKMLKDAGFRCCILKGQGTALYYEHPELRQCGDIDIWVEGERDAILRYAKLNCYYIGHVDIKHSDIEFFKEVPVEVHFMPSWMYRPSTNRKIQQYFEEQSDRQFGNYDSEVGFTHTTINFDLVYSIVHIYRHIFSEGIGLRQLMDYYYILKRSSQEQRMEAFKILVSLRMGSFVGGVMWILKNRFGLSEEFLLCSPNGKHGSFLLKEILLAGNFGQYDLRTKRVNVERRFKRGFVQLEKNWRFVTYYPTEVLWSPLWKVWHYVWRKRKGYL